MSWCWPCCIPPTIISFKRHNNILDFNWETGPHSQWYRSFDGFVSWFANSNTSGVAVQTETYALNRVSLGGVVDETIPFVYRVGNGGFAPLTQESPPRRFRDGVVFSAGAKCLVSLDTPIRGFLGGANWPRVAGGFFGQHAGAIVEYRARLDLLGARVLQDDGITNATWDWEFRNADTLITTLTFNVDDTAATIQAAVDAHLTGQAANYSNLSITGGPVHEAELVIEIDIEDWMDDGFGNVTPDWYPWRFIWDGPRDHLGIWNWMDEKLEWHDRPIIKATAKAPTGGIDLGGNPVYDTLPRDFWFGTLPDDPLYIPPVGEFARVSVYAFRMRATSDGNVVFQDDPLGFAIPGNTLFVFDPAGQVFVAARSVITNDVSLSPEHADQNPDRENPADHQTMDDRIVVRWHHRLVEAGALFSAHVLDNGLVEIARINVSEICDQMQASESTIFTSGLFNFEAFGEDVDYITGDDLRYHAWDNNGVQLTTGFDSSHSIIGDVNDTHAILLKPSALVSTTLAGVVILVDDPRQGFGGIRPNEPATVENAPVWEIGVFPRFGFRNLPAGIKWRIVWEKGQGVPHVGPWWDIDHDPAAIATDINAFPFIGDARNVVPGDIDPTLPNCHGAFWLAPDANPETNWRNGFRFRIGGYDNGGGIFLFSPGSHAIHNRVVPNVLNPNGPIGYVEFDQVVNPTIDPNDNMRTVDRITGAGDRWRQWQSNDPVIPQEVQYATDGTIRSFFAAELPGNRNDPAQNV